MKKLFTISFQAIVFFTILTSTQSISAQIVNIPDANFKAALVGNLTINTNGDAEIQLTEAEAFTGSMNVSSLGINDMTGIEAFSSITGLNMSVNNVMTIDLTNCGALTTLDCANNNLVSLDLSYNYLLQTLICPNNNLTCLDLSHNPDISNIGCNNNNLTKINVKNGNATGISNLMAVGNAGPPQCIQIDPGEITAFFSLDTWATTSINCGIPVANFSTNAPVCNGSVVVFFDLSTNATNYLWNFGDGNTDSSPSPSHSYAGAGSYMITMMVSGCYGKDTAYGSVQQGTDIYGLATKPGGEVTDGYAILYPYLGWYQAFDTLQISPLGPGGAYNFDNVPDGDYLIQIYPDTAIFPSLIPTYYTGNGPWDWAWDSAAVFTHGCTSDSYTNINVIELPSINPGPGLMQGVVIEGAGFGRAQGDPVPGVVVKRGIAATSQIVETTFTDANGQYTFNNLEYGTYTIYVDIPGLERDSCYTFTLDAFTPQYQNLYYVVDSTAIYIIPGIGIEDVTSEDKNKLDVFPNPVKDNSTIAYTINNNADVQLEVYNVYGVKVQTLLSETHLVSGEYTCNFNPKNANLKSGIYFISLIADGKRKTARIVVME